MTELPFYEPTGNEISLFEHAFHQRLPLLIKGPTGCGKTRFVAHMAARLKLPLYTVACHDDLTAADLVGRHLISDKGTYWSMARSPAPCAKAASATWMKWSRHARTPRSFSTRWPTTVASCRSTAPAKPRSAAQFHAGCFLQPGLPESAQGPETLHPPAFRLDALRLPGAEREISILIGETGCDADLAKRLVGIAKAFRALKDRDLEEVASTRLLVYAATLIKSGFDVSAACRAALVESLTDDEETVEALMEIVNATFGR
jgi:nitric oxide reductase NorQ protein